MSDSAKYKVYRVDSEPGRHDKEALLTQFSCGRDDLSAVRAAANTAAEYFGAATIIVRDEEGHGVCCVRFEWLEGAE